MPLSMTYARLARSKIWKMGDLPITLDVLRKQGAHLVLCHGCFDLLHIGHVYHFWAAKEQGSILVVTVTADEFIDKPNRPVFPESLRAEMIAAIGCVDFVSVSRYPTAVEIIKLLKPDVFVKGNEFEDLPNENVKSEAKAVEMVGGRIFFTSEPTFSSTKLLERYCHELRRKS